jgi:hypothetical protein
MTTPRDLLIAAMDTTSVHTADRGDLSLALAGAGPAPVPAAGVRSWKHGGLPKRSRWVDDSTSGDGLLTIQSVLFSWCAACSNAERTV